jgi:CheY-like chemotaxis protein
MSKKILLADDSVTIQKVVELTFMDEGVTVVAVGNGADAIARLAEVQPDVVIADVHMPGANGYEVAKRAKAMHPGLPVLLLVGTFEPFSKEEFAASGADASMKKPFDSQELLREVKQMLERGGEPEEVAQPVGEESGWQLDEADPLESTAVEPHAPEPAPATPTAPPAAPVAYAPAVTAPPAPVPAATAPPAAGPLSDADVDRIARRVVELIGDRVIREVSWEVIPDLAEVVIKDRLRELESQVE